MIYCVDIQMASTFNINHFLWSNIIYGIREMYATDNQLKIHDNSVLFRSCFFFTKLFTFLDTGLIRERK